MDAPLWTETHAPDLADLPQPDVRDYLTEAVNEPINLVLHGPEGVGKTAAARALAREAHADPDNDLVEINVADFFGRTKTEIKNDPRFAPFLEGRSRMSKRDMINHVLKESAAHQPVSGTYKTVLLDNAEAIREDFQQALRRVMEQYARTTQFVIATRQPSKLIPPIESRCFPVPMRSPTHDETATVLRRILDAEDVAYDDQGIDFVASYGDGDLRRAILGAQLVASKADDGDGAAVTMDTAYEALGEVGVDAHVEEMLAAAASGDFDAARSTLDDLLEDEGLSGDELLAELLRVARESNRNWDLARLHQLAGEVDMDLVEGTSDRVHLSHLLAELGRSRGSA
ncbi:AAA family ATPase [Haloglomus salinum]|jgi:replication factor C small subunit|uniref:AAA family ATPase n=1 Tax=Haloglomus salinum TaxID=2962673 RepID=UPI0020C993AE|nr:AAA family ATPase [Haloglomus salinum]